MKFRHRRELHALIPRQADREGIDSLAQLFEEGIDDRSANERELETGAPLP